MEDVSERASNDLPEFLAEIWNWDLGSRLLDLALASAPEKVDLLLEALLTVPRTFTFVDFIVLADGRRYVRIWDVSQYPSLYTYVDGDLKVKDDMWYRPKQLLNPAMLAFHLRAIEGLTPYTFTPLQYDTFLSLPNDPWTRRYRDRVEKLIDRLDLDEEGWTVDEFLPTIPRETIGFHADGEPLEDTDDPFPSSEGIHFPTSGQLPSN